MKKLIQNGISEENEKDWFKSIQLEMNSEKKKYIATYLSWNLKKKNFLDLPCYTKDVVQQDFKNKIWRLCNEWVTSLRNRQNLGPFDQQSKYSRS